MSMITALIVCIVAIAIIGFCDWSSRPARPTQPARDTAETTSPRPAPKPEIWQRAEHGVGLGPGDTVVTTVTIVWAREHITLTRGQMEWLLVEAGYSLSPAVPEIEAPEK